MNVALLLLLGVSLGAAAEARAETTTEEVTISRAMELLRGSALDEGSPTVIIVEELDEPPPELEINIDIAEPVADSYLYDSVTGSVERPPSRWHRQWWAYGEFGGEVDYRYAELKDSTDLTTTGRDFSFQAWYTMQPLDNWTLYLALHSANRDRPLSNWIDADSLEIENWLKLSEYWSRLETELTAESAIVAKFGRFAYPFDQTQLVFDNDLHMSGACVQYEWEPGESKRDTRLRGGVYAAQLLDPGTLELAPARLVSSRLDLRRDYGPDSRYEAALGYHNFSNVDTLGQAVADGDWRVGGITGNGETTNLTAADSAGDLVSDYEIANIWLRSEWLRDSDWPVELEVELARNLAARGDGAAMDDAWYAGVSYGKCKESGDWQFGYDHAEVETEAVLAAVNRGEYATNYAGDRLEARYCPAPGIEWQLNYTWSDNLSADDSQFSFDDEEVRIYMTISW